MLILRLSIIIIILAITTMCSASDNKEYDQMVKDRDARFALKEAKEHELALEEIRCKILSEQIALQKSNEITIINNNENSAESNSYSANTFRRVKK